MYWRESATVREANDLIAGEHYAAAIPILTRFAPESHLFSREAEYLIALAMARQYASEKGYGGGTSAQLAEPTRRLQDLFKAGEGWRVRAKSDLAGLIAKVPNNVRGGMERSAAIARFLAELSLGDPKDLAKELLEQAHTVCNNSDRGSQDIDAAAAELITTWDPSLLGDLVTLALDHPNGVLCVTDWAGQRPSMAGPLGSVLSQRASALANRGQYSRARQALGLADLACPKQCPAYAQKHLEWLRSSLGEKDYAGVVHDIEAVPFWRYDAAATAEAANMCVQAAQTLSKTDRATARAALDQALKLSPQTLDSETNLLLWFELNSEPTPAKLARCKNSRKSSRKARAGEIRMSVLTDAMAFRRTTGANSEKDLDAFMDAAGTEAKRLLETQPKAEGLDARTFALARCVAESGRPPEAIELATFLFAHCPDTPLKPEAEKSIAQWQKMPRVGPAQPPPGHGTRPEDLETQLLRRKRTINTSTAVYDAVTNKEIWIIEVADSCRADQFDAEQARLLRDWVAEGGVLWVNSSVLSLFGVRHTTFKCFGTDLECDPAGGSHAVLENCKKVWLHNCDDDKAHTLQYKGVVPLLAFRKAYGMGFGAPGRGSTLWSLVPYGKGWISDPETIGHGTRRWPGFWGHFASFAFTNFPGRRRHRLLPLAATYLPTDRKCRHLCRPPGRLRPEPSSGLMTTARRSR